MNPRSDRRKRNTNVTWASARITQIDFRNARLFAAFSHQINSTLHASAGGSLSPIPAANTTSTAGGSELTNKC